MDNLDRGIGEVLMLFDYESGLKFLVLFLVKN